MPETEKKSTGGSLQAIDEYFSNSLRRVLIYANEEARNAQAVDIDTEHLLLGLMRNAEQDQVLNKLFQNLKIDLKEFDQIARKEVKSGKNEKPAEYLPFSARTKNALIAADQQRRQWNHHMTAGEHMIVVLAKEEGVASKILKKFGLTPEVLSQAVLAIVGKGKSKDVLTGGGSTPTLDQFGDDMCQMAREGKIDAVIGRSEEIERAIHILARRRKNNPLLLGEPGVGKTAIVEGLALRVVNGDVPEVLKGKRLVSIALNNLIAGASKRGQFEERLNAIMKETITSQGEIILFIDEIHTLFTGDVGDAAQIMKPPLARGEIHCIGATTLDEHHEYMEGDAAFSRRFQIVNVPEPNMEESVQILMGSRDKYEAFHKVKISDDIVKLSVKLSDRYITDRRLPDKAFDLIDEACAMARVPSISTPEKEKKLVKEIEKMDAELQRARGVVSIEEITSMSKKLGNKRKELEELRQNAEDEKSRSHDEVTEEHIIKIIGKWSGVPMGKLAGSESERLLGLEKQMHERLIGQEYPVKVVANAVKRGRSGIRKPKRPIGSFLFLGPSGVGKTEFAKTLGECLFGGEQNMIRFDMSEFMEKHALSRLTGPPPGYVGYEKGGELTEAVRKHPYTVILFDEVEKAHRDIFLLLLQILDDGRLTDNHGRVVSFKHSVLICTSNIAGAEIVKRFEEYWSATGQQTNSVVTHSEKTSEDFVEKQGVESSEGVEEKEKSEDGDGEEKTEGDDFQKMFAQQIEGNPEIQKQDEAEVKKVVHQFTETPHKAELHISQEEFQKQAKEAVLPELLQFFRPEVLNRFDDVVCFSPLRKKDLKRIVEIMLREPRQMLGERDMNLRVSDGAKAFLADKGYDPAFGARPLRRAIQSYLEDPLSEKLIAGVFQDKDGIYVDVDLGRDCLTFQKDVSDKGAKDMFDEVEKNKASILGDTSGLSPFGDDDSDEEKSRSSQSSQQEVSTEVTPSIAPEKSPEEQSAPANGNIEPAAEEEEKSDSLPNRDEEKKSFFEKMFVKPKAEEEKKDESGGGVRFVDGKIVMDE